MAPGPWSESNCPARAGTALDYVIGTYARSEQLGACIDLLVAAGGTTRYNAPAVLHVLGCRLDRLVEQLDADPALVHRQFPELDFGSTGGRRLLLQGATLLQVAAEYGMSTPPGFSSSAARTSTRVPRWTTPASAGKRPFSTRSHSSRIEVCRWRNSSASTAPT